MLLNLREVYRIAVNLEKSAADFYAKAAEIAGDDTRSGALRRLKEMEEGHYRYFSGLYEKVSASEELRTKELRDYVLQYHGSNLYEQSARELDKLFGLTPYEIYRYARDMEVRAIVFYALIVQETADPEIKSRLIAIVEEERGHQSALEYEMEKLSAQK